MEEADRRSRRVLALWIALLCYGTALTFLPNKIRCRCQGTLTSCKSNLKNIGTALEMYADDHHGKYPGSISVLTPAYLKVLPRCSGSFGPDQMHCVQRFARDSYSRSYQVGPTGQSYTFYCAGSRHTQRGQPANDPQYNSSQGLICKATTEEEESAGAYVPDPALLVTPLVLLVALLVLEYCCCSWRPPAGPVILAAGRPDTSNTGQRRAGQRGDAGGGPEQLSGDTGRRTSGHQ